MNVLLVLMIGELRCLKCPYYIKHTTNSFQSLSKCEFNLYQNQYNNQKICMDKQKIFNSINNYVQEVNIRRYYTI